MVSKPTSLLESDDAPQRLAALHGVERLFGFLERDDAGHDAIEIKLSLGVPVGQKRESPASAGNRRTRTA